MPARGRAIRTLLVLVDPNQPGASDEVERLCTSSETLGLSTTVAETLDAARDALARPWDAIHYAGHQGPTHDDSPALVLREGSLPILELVDRIEAEPPELLFLNACSTLVPTGLDRASGHVDFGGLEPVIASSVPQILGTLWDVKPPDTRFVESFYGTLFTGASAIDALFEARRAVASSLAWAGTAPAYVLYARRPD